MSRKRKWSDWILNAPTLLGVLFVGLRLTGHIDWHWWLVTLPLWAPFALIAAVLIVSTVPVMLVAGAEHIAFTRRLAAKRRAEQGFKS